MVGNYYYKTIREIKDIKYGIRVKLNGELSVPNKNTVPNAFNYRKYLNNKGINFTININSIEVINDKVSFVNRVRNWLCSWVDDFDTTGYVKGFVLGIKDNIDENEYNMYQNIGVTHLFAISGMHISVVVVVLNRLFKRFHDKVRYLIIDVILLLYGSILYFPASLKRTIWFFIVNGFNKMFGLKLGSIRVLFLVVFCLVLFDFKIIYDIGFIYSVVTVGGILFSNDYIKSDKKIISCFKLSLIAFLFSLPITLYNFYSINLLSVFFNMFYVLFVRSVIYPFSLIVIIVPKLYILFQLLVNIMVWFSNIFDDIDLFIFYLDFNFFEVLLFYLILLLFIYYRKMMYFVFLMFLLFVDLIIPYFDNNAYVYFFDVGQGDSSLIVKPYRKEIIMIDTGGVRNRKVSDSVISFMKSKGIKKIDYLILSHGDFDHMGDAVNVMNSIKIDKVLFNSDGYNELESAFIDSLIDKEINYSNVIDISGVSSLNDEFYDNENDDSSVLLFNLYGYKFLFTGDAGAEVEKDLIKKYNLNKIDVLKVGHHGSKSSSSKKFIDEIKPSYSIISVGKNNRYGHPNNNVLDNLENSKIYRTDQDGSIMFKIKNDKLQIETCPP